MKNLIIYETKHGTVEHAVSLLADRLEGQTRTARVSDGSIPPIAEFDTVILGGSIYFGKIQKALSTFIVKHTDELLQKRLGLFICGAHPDSNEREKELREAFPEKLREHALAKEVFGFQIHFQSLNRLEKSIAKSILRQKEDKEGLDMEAIASFAEKFK
ncbi:flavodoxin domain-containing protein [Bacillus sp. B-jedd]|uniref:flavodoxin domain-containing protein n=1 Tax=Bacillus sp. B-jedd TaxID=1476857 RepID=UPI0005155EAE|nr:flavodoxin domain-containing protein [Bacillus sp. B-jedd]CEG25547.1 flavodoxin-like protein [Bacillus sp. B-jedd]